MNARPKLSIILPVLNEARGIAETLAALRPLAAEIIVVDGGSGLDTGCSYRSDGPLEIVVAITRWAGPVDADGRLINPSALITSGVVSPSATIVLPAFDFWNWGKESGLLFGLPAWTWINIAQGVALSAAFALFFRRRGSPTLTG